jgi:plastocyanin
VARWTRIPAPTARRRLSYAAAGLAAATLTLTACGTTSTSSSAATTSSAPAPSSTVSAGSPSSGGSSQATSITATEADFSISLDQSSLTAGSYTITVANKGHATHDLVVEQGGASVAKTDSISPGGTGSLRVTLKPGDYVFYCSIGNHRSMGMELPVHVS